MLHRDRQAAYLFPPRAIQKARPPTGPSLRLGIPGSLVNARRVACVRRLFPGVERVPCFLTRGSVLSKHLITLGGSTSFCSSTDKPPVLLIRHAKNGVGAISARPSSSASLGRERGSEESIRPPEAPDLERLAVRLGAAGNYAFRVEGTTLLAAFEDDGDAQRFAQVFRPTQITRESEWASKAWARIDDDTLRRKSRISSEARA